jgi:hypothetical protein
MIRPPPAPTLRQTPIMCHAGRPAREPMSMTIEQSRYLLYIDMLGFSSLVMRKGQVDELYEIINSLNAHKHDSFKTIVFSDTALIYNIHLADTAERRRCLIMFLCEFAQDLFYRLIGRDLHFRAYLTRGEFKHYKMQNLEAFYGDSLIRAYTHEKEIQCTGLFIENELLKDCAIFHGTPYDEKCSFVHVMQSLDYIRFEDDPSFPLSPELIVPMGYEWFLAYDFTYLRNIHRSMNNMQLPPKVRVKYLSAWQMIGSRHKPLLDTLERNNFDPRSVSDFDWSEPMRRVGTPDGYHD